MHIVILCNGRAPHRKRIAAACESSDLFIAADGGANLARQLNLQPDYIIGDLDSYEATPEEAVLFADRLIKDPGQETNDLEKALEFALKKEASEVTVFGATGNRLDHTLKNLSVLKRFHARFPMIRFADNYGELFLLPRIYRTTLPAGTVLSLFPLSGRTEGITTTGLKYPLYDESLEIGRRDGTSNITMHEEIVITHKKGDLLIMISAE